jgi:ABC-type phosphate transport system substrate-binding protein
MTLLMSVHVVVDASIRLYASHEAALADRKNWKQSDAASDFLGFRLVRFKDGVPVEESAAANAALTEIPDDLRYSLTNAPGKDSYAISGTVWAVLYVNQPPGKGKAVIDFLRWVTHDGQNYAKDLDYARLPDEPVQRLEKKLDQVQVSR